MPPQHSDTDKIHLIKFLKSKKLEAAAEKASEIKRERETAGRNGDTERERERRGD